MLRRTWLALSGMEKVFKKDIGYPSLIHQFKPTAIISTPCFPGVLKPDHWAGSYHQKEVDVLIIN